MNWRALARPARADNVVMADAVIPARETLRVFRCPEPGCGFAHKDAEVTFVHLMSGHSEPKGSAA